MRKSISTFWERNIYCTDGCHRTVAAAIGGRQFLRCGSEWRMGGRGILSAVCPFVEEFIDFVLVLLWWSVGGSFGLLRGAAVARSVSFIFALVEYVRNICSPLPPPCFVGRAESNIECLLLVAVVESMFCAWHAPRRGVEPPRRLFVCIVPGKRVEKSDGRVLFLSLWLAGGVLPQPRGSMMMKKWCCLE